MFRICHACVMDIYMWGGIRQVRVSGEREHISRTGLPRIPLGNVKQAGAI